MVSIFELTYRYILPSVRRSLVNELRKYGMSQKEIAEVLKVDYSTISKYLSAKRGSLTNFIAYNDVHSRISKLAFKIKKNALTHYEIYLEIYKIALYILAKKYACKLHTKLDPWININNCHVCPSLFHKI